VEKFIDDKVYYKIFDRSFKQSSHIYNKKSKFNQLVPAEEVKANKQSVINYFAATNVLILQQVHGNKIIDTDLGVDFNLEADGAVTTQEGLVLAIQTADCVPILLSSDNGKVIGAAHCGWRGAKANIVHNLVNLMKQKWASNIKALIGPAIQQSSYEVDQEYFIGFIKENPENAVFFIDSPRPHHYMFDLPSYVELKLKQAGVENIVRMTDDTYSMPERYPSYRRSCHSTEEYRQNILSTIVIARNDASPPLSINKNS